MEVIDVIGRHRQEIDRRSIRYKTIQTSIVMPT
jgi:hypothetical protein